MSTSETVTFNKGPCPCGAGTIEKHVTTQDNPWSSADVQFTIACKSCESTWRLEQKRLVLRSSESEYLAARKREEHDFELLRRFADSLVEDYFAKYSAKSKKAELAEMTRLRITNLSYPQYLKHRSEGKTPTQACSGLRNQSWLSKLAAEHSQSDKLSELLSTHRSAEQTTRDAEKKIIRKSIE